MGHDDLATLDEIFRPPRAVDAITAGREADDLAVAPVDLGMEEEVGGEPTALRRIDAALRVADQERGDGRAAVLVADLQRHGHRRGGAEEEIDVRAEAQVLGPLPDVEREFRLAGAGVPAVDLDDPVFERQAREGPVQGTFVEHPDIGPAIRDRPGGDARLRFRAVGRLLVDRRRVRALDPERGRHPRLVVDLHQEDPPASLRQFLRGRARDAFTRLSGLIVTPIRQSGSRAS